MSGTAGRRGETGFSAGSLILIILVSVLESRILFFLHAGNLGFVTGVYDAILRGDVFIPAFQNRLLGPLVCTWVQRLAGTPPAATFLIFLLAATTLTNAVLYGLFLRHAGTRAAAAKYTVFAAALFVALQHNRFLYAWDLLGFLIFSVFAYGVFRRKGTWYFAALFPVALLNREDALFIALWLIIDAFEPAPGKTPAVRIASVPKLSAGVLMAGAAFLFTRLLRVRPPAEGTGPHLFGNQFELPVSLKRIFRPDFFSIEFVITVFIAAAVYFFIANRRRYSLHDYRILALLSVMFLFTVTFGVVNETRVWLIFVPFVLMFDASFGRAAQAPGEEA